MVNSTQIVAPISRKPLKNIAIELTWFSPGKNFAFFSAISVDVEKNYCLNRMKLIDQTRHAFDITCQCDIWVLLGGFLLVLWLENEISTSKPKMAEF